MTYTMAEPGVRISKVPTIANGPLPAEGNGRFSNAELVAAVVLGPWLIAKVVPFISVRIFSWTHLFFIVLLGLPITVGYWTFNSMYGPRKNEKCRLPNRPQSDYFVINNPELKAKYGDGKAKIPMQVWHDAYFEGKIDIKGDMLEVLEYRHDWASFVMTWPLFHYVFTRLIPEVILHTTSQDEEQVRDHYDRGDDFYAWFLGPRMIYTSGVISDETKVETLEQLQDNKLALVCRKLDLQPSDHLLDIGCGWGTLAAFAAKNYGCDVTGVTLGKNQTKFGNDRIAANGVSPDKARILCLDARDIPAEPRGRFTKIVSLEMAEHVGIRRYQSFMRQVKDLLADDGTFLLQVAGIRNNWQYEDLIWGLFMNKYIFPGADASCALGWVVNQVESAGFEVKSIDVLGVHYSATLLRWYKNWLSNEAKVKAKYGDRWFRIWTCFLAWSTIISRQGSASVFQLTLHKNLNGYHRAEGVSSHTSIHFEPDRKLQEVVCQPVENA